MTQSSAGQSKNVASVATKAIRPFHVNISEEHLKDLRRLIAATQWPEQELVKDPSQGVQLATMKKLADYWAKNYDWRKTEARLNSYPQFEVKGHSNENDPKHSDGSAGYRKCFRATRHVGSASWD